MVILRTRNKITDFLMILAWASPFNMYKGMYCRENNALRRFSVQSWQYHDRKKPKAGTVLILFRMTSKVFV